MRRRGVPKTLRRENNPVQEQKNRAQTRFRMRKNRRQRLFDKSKSILAQIVGGKIDKCYLTRGSRWLMVRLTKAMGLTI